MRFVRLVAILVVVLASGHPARAADSVVVGRAVSNTFIPTVYDGCVDGICLEPWFVWKLSISRTISGPPVTGRVLASHQQHAGFTGIERYRVFLLSPIEQPAQRKILHADFYLVEMSENQCLSEKPQELSAADVHVVHTDHGDRYCFALSLK